jgi:hypothetical protein
VFLVGGFVLSLLLSRAAFLRWQSPRSFFCAALLALAVAMLLAGGMAAAVPGSLDPVLRSLAFQTEDQGWPSLLLVAGLTPFAVRRQRQQALTALAFLAMIPILQLLPPIGSYPWPVIDEPLAKMTLFLPLSALGGLGFAGLGAWIRSVRDRTRPVATITLAIAALVYLGCALAARTYFPGECCRLAGADDAEVIRFASELPSESRILIPAQPGIESGLSAVDGGAWIVPLAQRSSLVWPAEADLRSPAEHRLLCGQGVTHVYVGGTPLSFSRLELELAPDYYVPLEVRPEAALYAVAGCDGS